MHRNESNSVIYDFFYFFLVNGLDLTSQSVNKHLHLLLHLVKLVSYTVCYGH